MNKKLAVLSVLFSLILLQFASESAHAQCKLGVPAIKVGVQGAASGPHSDYGRQIEMGATTGDGGDQRGRRHRSAARSRCGSWTTRTGRPPACKNARLLVTDWGAHFTVGTDSSGVAMAMGPVLAELKRIQFFTHAATHRLTEELVASKGIKEIVRVSVPIYQDAIIAALIFKDRKDIKRWANIGADYEYGYVAWNLFKETLKKYRPDVEFVGEAWAPFLTLDFSPHVSAVMAQKPDAIFATPWAGEAVQLLRTAADPGRVRQRAGLVAGDGRLGRRAGGDHRGGRRRTASKASSGRPPVTSTTGPTLPRTRHSSSASRNAGSAIPNYSAETTYSAFFIMKAAVEKAGSLDTRQGRRSAERHADQESRRRAHVQGRGPAVHLQRACRAPDDGREVPDPGARRPEGIRGQGLLPAPAVHARCDHEGEVSERSEACR